MHPFSQARANYTRLPTLYFFFSLRQDCGVWLSGWAGRDLSSLLPEARAFARPQDAFPGANE